MSDKKIIIRNCPALQQTYYCDAHHSKCQDCIDCIMKQIYKLCKDDYIQFDNKELRYHTFEEIIKLLNIQGVE